MLARTGELASGADRLRIARLAGYRLVFQEMDGETPAYANILSPGEGVLGVVYHCSAAALDALDIYEHCYARQAVTVVDEQGEVIQAIAYIVRSDVETKFGPPSPEYLQKILTGAQQHGLPAKYIGELVEIDGRHCKSIR